jgi:flavin-dependent dehydrogenase
MGVVIDSDLIRKFGNTAEEQLDTYLRHDPVIRDYAAPARRVSPVVRYSNYQSLAARGVGHNWALVGDTFGFVDPVFSSGLLLAFQGAERLANALIDGSERMLAAYEKESLRNVKAWQRVIGWFYDGRLLTPLKVGSSSNHARASSSISTSAAHAALFARDATNRWPRPDRVHGELRSGAQRPAGARKLGRGHEIPPRSGATPTT